MLRCRFLLLCLAALLPLAGTQTWAQNADVSPVLPGVVDAAQPPKDGPSPAPKGGDEKKPEVGGAEKKPDASSANLVFKAFWKDGLYFETPDKAFKFNVGGRTQVDFAWMSAGDPIQFGPGGVGRIDDAVNPRRARFDIVGTIYRNIDFYCQFDFVNTFVTERPGGVPRVTSVPAPTDLWVTFTELPYLGNLRVGNQKQPISFEHMTSSRFLNFLERSKGFDAFVEEQANGFQPGISVFNWYRDERITAQVGLFKITRNTFAWNTGDGEGEVTARVTGLPIYEADGRYLVHVGLGGSHRDLDDHVARFRGRTDVRNGPAVLHTILADASMIGRNQQLLVPEFVVVWGPWSLQTEYYASWVHGAVVPVNPPAARVVQGTVFFQAYYIEGHVFLTGEHRPYNKKAAAFGRVVPRRNASWANPDCGPRGWGGWQLTARYSLLDLSDKGVQGGVVNSFAVGLNWFLNPNMKVQWNYALDYRDAPGNTSDGYVHNFGTRLAWDF